MIHFAHPEILLLLLLLPLMALLRGRHGPAPSLRFSSLEVLRTSARSRRTALGRLPASLRLLSLSLLIIALARPQFVRGFTEVEASGIDIVLGIDVSGSMEALDFELNGKPANRLAVVKQAARQFIGERPNDRIAVLAFAARPYVASPLTLDHDWLLQRLEQVKIGTVEDGTAIGSAIAASTNRLRNEQSKSRIIIILTDGMNNAGKISPELASEAAKAMGVRIYTVGVGTRGKAPIPVTDAFGRRQLAMTQVDIDEDSLKKIADESGGKYYRATDTGSLQKIYAEINSMEKTTRNIRKFSTANELFAYLALASLLTLFFELMLVHAWYRRAP